MGSAALPLSRESAIRERLAGFFLFLCPSHLQVTPRSAGKRAKKRPQATAVGKPSNPSFWTHEHF
jgi:hypothetical protein